MLMMRYFSEDLHRPDNLNIKQVSPSSEALLEDEIVPASQVTSFGMDPGITSRVAGRFLFLVAASIPPAGHNLIDRIVAPC